MKLFTFRGYEDEDTAVHVADRIVAQCTLVERDYPTDNRAAGYRLAQLVRDNDPMHKVFCIYVYQNFIRVVPHNLMGLRFPAEIILKSRDSAPVK